MGSLKISNQAKISLNLPTLCPAPLYSSHRYSGLAALPPPSPALQSSKPERHAIIWRGYWLCFQLSHPSSILTASVYDLSDSSGLCQAVHLRQVPTLNLAQVAGWLPTQGSEMSIMKNLIFLSTNLTHQNVSDNSLFLWWSIHHHRGFHVFQLECLKLMKDKVLMLWILQVYC